MLILKLIWLKFYFINNTSDSAEFKSDHRSVLAELYSTIFNIHLPDNYFIRWLDGM